MAKRARPPENLMGSDPDERAIPERSRGQTPPGVLIVDDEPEILDTTKWAFEMAGYQVHTAASAEEALPQAESFRPDVLLIDYKLPQMNGLELLRKVRSWIPNAVAIMITGLTHQSESLEEESRQLGAIGFLHKPLQLEHVLKMVKEKLRASTGSARTGPGDSGQTGPGKPGRTGG